MASWESALRRPWGGRRVCGGRIDSALIVTGWASVIGGPLIWARLRGIREDKLHEALSRRMTAVFGAGEVGRRRSRRITFAIRVTGFGLRNRSSPGRRLL